MKPLLLIAAVVCTTALSANVSAEWKEYTLPTYGKPVVVEFVLQKNKNITCVWVSSDHRNGSLQCFPKTPATKGGE